METFCPFVGSSVRPSLAFGNVGVVVVVVVVVVYAFAVVAEGIYCVKRKTCYIALLAIYSVGLLLLLYQ